MGIPRRIILAVLVVSLLVTGCATTSHLTQNNAAPSNERDGLTFNFRNTAADDSSGGVRSEFTLLRYEPTPEERLDDSWSWSEPRLRLCLAEPEVQPEDPTPPAASAPKKESLFSLNYLKLVGSDVKEVFTAPADWDKNDWFVLGGVTAGIGLAFAFDEDIRNAVQRNRNDSVDKVFDAIEPFGAQYSFGVLAAFYVGGEIFHDPKAKSVALDGLSASFIAAGLIAQPLKFVTGRSRPHQEQGAYDFQPFGAGINTSFPSGHTTQAFAIASVIATHYDSLWVKFTSYGLASAVGYARMNNDAHWASDVLTGAAIGTFVGHVVVHFNEQHRNFSFLPIIGPDLKGAQVKWSF